MTANETADGAEQSVIPVGPCDFGWKTGWLAFKTTKAEEVIEALSLSSARQSGWKHGIGVACYSDWWNDPRVFVLPPIDGWTLAVGGCLPSLENSTPGGDRVLRELIGWRNNFSEVQYFGTHRVSGFSAYAKMKDGLVVRAYAEDNMGMMINCGNLTEEEIELGFQKYKWTGTDSDEFFVVPASYPTEGDILKLAGRWSVNPTLLTEMGLEPSSGWLGKWDASDPADLLMAYAMNALRARTP